MSLWEADMVQCENGHIFCMDEMIEKTAEEWVEFIQNTYNEYPSNPTDVWGMKMEYLRDFDGRYAVHESFCPICQMHVLNDTDFMNYMCKKLDITREYALREIQNKFDSYREFRDWIKK